MTFGAKFPQEYKDKIFYLWYNKGKPNNLYLYNMIPVDTATGNKAAQNTLKLWIDTEFRPRAEALDTKVAEELEGRLIQEKIQMLQKHAALGVKMQDMAMNYLDEHAKDLTSSSAVRLLVEGVRIERGSRGIPEALQDMMEKSDEELLEEISSAFANAPIISEEPND